MTFQDLLSFRSPEGSGRRIRAGSPLGVTGPGLLLCCVGVAGFEPTTSSSRTKRATKLRYTPSVPGNTS